MYRNQTRNTVGRREGIEKSMTENKNSLTDCDVGSGRNLGRHLVSFLAVFRPNSVLHKNTRLRTGDLFDII